MSSFSNEVKLPTLTQQPNALPASERCPGQPGKDMENCFISVPSDSPSVMTATNSSYVASNYAGICVRVNFYAPHQSLADTMVMMDNVDKKD